MCIDTTDTKAVCCFQSTYGIHKKKITTECIFQLEDNGWIRDCTRIWGVMLSLVPKSYQYSCSNIKQFGWRLCVSYRSLNSVTRLFEYSSLI